MGVVARVKGQTVFLREGAWRCADPDLEAELNRLTERWIQETGGPALSAKDPEREVARELTRRYRGRILAHVPARGHLGARRYFRQRQLNLFP